MPVSTFTRIGVIADTHGGLLVFNPGAAGVTRLGVPASVGLLQVRDAVVSGEIVFLDA